MRKLTSLVMAEELPLRWCNQTLILLPKYLKPHSHCAGVATVHPDAGQPVYRDAPGHIS